MGGLVSCIRGCSMTHCRSHPFRSAPSLSPTECVVSDMSCVPQQADDGRYPVPTPDQVVPKFDTKFFNGKLYISAGQNELFDIFDCQVHFFTETEPGA